MAKGRIAQEVWELRAEAAEARDLAATFEDNATVHDLLSYASALDRDAAQLEKSSLQKPFTAPVGPLEIAGHILPTTRARSHSKA